MSKKKKLANGGKKTMPAEQKAPKKGPAVARSPAVKKPPAAKRPAAKSSGFFVVRPTIPSLISANGRSGEESLRQFATFAEARAAAIDALVEAIEAAEAQLLAIKRAQGPNDLLG